MDKLKFKKDGTVTEAWYGSKKVDEYDTDTGNTKSKEEWMDDLKDKYDPKKITEKAVKRAAWEEKKRLAEAIKTPEQREAERLEEERQNRLKCFYFQMKHRDKDNDMFQEILINAETQEEAEKIFKKFLASVKITED
jgi:hypothetical protein